MHLMFRRYRAPGFRVQNPTPGPISDVNQRWRCYQKHCLLPGHDGGVSAICNVLTTNKDGDKCSCDIEDEDLGVSRKPILCKKKCNMLKRGVARWLV